MSLIEVLVAISLLSGGLLLCLNEHVHLQRVCTELNQKNDSYRQQVNQQELCRSCKSPVQQ